MFKAFLREIANRPCLTEVREAECWRLYKEEDSVEARAEIIESYQPLVYKVVVSSIKGATPEIELDIVQEGIMGLIEAVERFDPSKGVRFSSYAPFRIRGRIINYIDRNYNRELQLDSNTQQMQEILGMGASFTDPTSRKRNVENIAEDDMLFDTILKSLDRLSEKERAVVRGIFIEDKKASDLARELGISNSYLSRLQKTGIRRIRGMLSRLMKEMKDVEKSRIK